MLIGKPNNSLNRSGISADVIRKDWMLLSILPARLIRALDFFVVAEAMIDSQLIDLLNENRTKPLVADCLERISRAGEVRYQAGAPVSLHQIVDIYSVRARINSELNNGAVEGFEHLLPALKAAPVSSVRLHSLEFVSQWYVIFTDESVSDMLGILKSPKQKAAWFDQAKGYKGVGG